MRVIGKGSAVQIAGIAGSLRGTYQFPKSTGVWEVGKNALGWKDKRYRRRARPACQGPKE